MCSYIKKLHEIKAQATVEAAFLIPVLFILLLLLIQPGILLYNHMVMQAAASEGCRLLATKTDAAEASNEDYESYIKRRLASIPPHDNFHVHNDSCSWEIELIGNENSEQVQVIIRNKVKLLPLMDRAGALLGFVNEEGAIVQEVSTTSTTQPKWLGASTEGLSPSAWPKEDI